MGLVANDGFRPPLSIEPRDGITALARVTDDTTIGINQYRLAKLADLGAWWEFLFALRFSILSF